jgi:hypothetical protein
MSLRIQIVWLFVLAIPVATISCTVTHEEVFREAREFLVRRSRSARSIYRRKFFYLFTCEFCLSHWVTLLFVAFTGFRLLLHDWRGYVIAFFALVWVANQYMSLYGRLRLDLKRERVEIRATEREVKRSAASAGDPEDDTGG